MKGEHRKKILVVDDDKIIVETIVQALEEDEHGFEMISASDGLKPASRSAISNRTWSFSIL